MTDAQTEGWSALLDLHTMMPTDWTLVGGQMVHLHCAERGVAPQRPTDDLDAVLDVRANPLVLHDFTAALARLGFGPAGTSPTGHQHRWVRGLASIDILIPTGVGERASARRGVSGGTTLQTPAAQQALDRTDDVVVVVAGREGVVRRPNLLGALVAKAAAYHITSDTARSRHLVDFAVLTTLIAPSDRVGAATARDRRRLVSTMGALVAERRTLLAVEGASDGFVVLRLALGID
jgi:hypothetical protein